MGAEAVLATGHDNGDICLWDMKVGPALHCFKAHDRPVNHVLFHRHSLISASADGSAKVFAFATWKLEQCYRMPGTASRIAVCGDRVYVGVDDVGVVVLNRDGSVTVVAKHADNVRALDIVHPRDDDDGR